MRLRQCSLLLSLAVSGALATFARAANGGLIITASGVAIRHRELIIALAARHKLPAVYFANFFTASGGLISYGADLIDQYRRAARYVDRILKGHWASSLPLPVYHEPKSAFLGADLNCSESRNSLRILRGLLKGARNRRISTPDRS